MIKNGGESVVDAYHILCNRILETGQWPDQWTESILILILKKKASKKCSEHRTISLICHPSKILLSIILNRIAPKVESILSETQAGFRKNRSTVEQITNLRVLCEKRRNVSNPVFRNFIDFKKAFDRVWHNGMFDTLLKFNIGKRMTHLMKQLYQKARTKVLSGNAYSEWFQATVGVRQGCILSPILFNLFLERIMLDALEDFEEGIKCGGKTVNNLRFADDIDLMAGKEEHLQTLTTRLDEGNKEEVKDRQYEEADYYR